MNAIIFDLDGTLIDSAPAVRAALNSTLIGAGFSTLPMDDVKGMIGQGMQTMLVMALKHFGEDPSHRSVERLCGPYVDHYLEGIAEHTIIYPDVTETLEILNQKDYQMGICTNKPSSITIPVLSALNFNRYFTAVSCGDSLPYKKPDARHIYAVLDEMGCDKSSAVFVGDSEWDIEAARNADIPIIVVSYGYSSAHLVNCSADELIERFDKLPSALESISSKAKL